MSMKYSIPLCSSYNLFCFNQRLQHLLSHLYLSLQYWTFSSTLIHLIVHSPHTSLLVVIPAALKPDVLRGGSQIHPCIRKGSGNSSDYSCINVMSSVCQSGKSTALKVLREQKPLPVQLWVEDLERSFNYCEWTDRIQRYAQGDEELYQKWKGERDVFHQIEVSKKHQLQNNCTYSWLLQDDVSAFGLYQNTMVLIPVPGCRFGRKQKIVSISLSFNMF